jgi:SecD/SecF fusion protein
VENSAVIAIIASLLAISVYIAWRFQWKYAVPVLIALMHDLLITAGVYALTGREVTASTVAALLTILGYSMYDTIIVFDRVRENVAKMQHAAFSQIVNRSMAEVLTRSLATSFCTLLPVLALLIFGGSTLKDFAFALLVGVASGAYSSIFIASPVLTHWKEREPVYRRRRARIAAENGGTVPPYATEGSAAREEAVEQRRRARGRLTTARPDAGVSPGEFRELVRDLHTEPRATPAKPEPKRDPTADARPEDVVMPEESARAAARARGASKSRANRRRGRPR